MSTAPFPIRYPVRALIAAASVILVAFIFYLVICRNGISATAAKNIQDEMRGMSKNELVKKLGEPHYIYPNGNWRYNVWGLSGFVLVKFNERDEVHDCSY